jgi:hypothetical protein
MALADSNKCFYCEYTFGSPVKYKGIILIKTKDHIIPISRDGNSSILNIVYACHQCNHLKGNRLPNEFSDFLKVKITQMQKGLGSYRNMTIQRIGTIVLNNDKLIGIIEPYKHKLLKTYKFKSVPKNPIKKKKYPLTSRHRIDDNPRIKMSELKDTHEMNLFLMHQTPEQFELAKKHGWVIAKMLTEPEPNFHY